MRLILNPQSLADYETFLKVKRLPYYRFEGRTAVVPDEYGSLIKPDAASVVSDAAYAPSLFLFDYQRAIAEIAIRKRKYCIFADCGLGKTLIFLEFAKHALQATNMQPVLIVSPLMVIQQTMAEAERWYKGKLPIERVPSSGVQAFLNGSGGSIGITNYEAFTHEIQPGNLGCLILDESSLLKSHYGKWGTELLRLGRGLDWKMACTGTPAPNDRIEYANHAVLMDAFPSVNSFLARFFVNRGQTGERWELKAHALRPFYKALSHWSIFLTDPSVYGWTDNTEPLPPIEVHQHHIKLTEVQQDLAYERTQRLFPDEIGGITSRSVLSQIAKGWHKGKPIPTLKPQAIRELVDQWPEESTIIWCLYNAEQRIIAEAFPEAHSMTGATPHARREEMIADFKTGRVKVIISKPKILGFGLNLHMATRQVFSGLQDSYESYYQAVKRSNRFGATRPLNVHIPYTDIEYPMIQTVLKKAKRVQSDTREQERLFRESASI